MKVVVGGPPNSGKSTVTAALVSLCRERIRKRGYNPTFCWQSLDVTDTSLPAMLDDSGSVSSDREVAWTTERAEERQAVFAARDEQLVIADLPGIVDELTEILVEPADTIVLVVSDEQRGQIDDWYDLTGRTETELFADLTTVLDDEIESRWEDRESRRGVIRSIHNEEFDENGTDSYDDTTRRILKQLSIELLEEAENGERREQRNE